MWILMLIFKFCRIVRNHSLMMSRKIWFRDPLLYFHKIFMMRGSEGFKISEGRSFDCRIKPATPKQLKTDKPSNFKSSQSQKACSSKRNPFFLFSSILLLPSHTKVIHRHWRLIWNSTHIEYNNMTWLELYRDLWFYNIYFFIVKTIKCRKKCYLVRNKKKGL